VHIFYLILAENIIEKHYRDNSAG